MKLRYCQICEVSSGINMPENLLRHFKQRNNFVIQLEILKSQALAIRGRHVDSITYRVIIRHDYRFLQNSLKDNQSFAHIDENSYLFSKSNRFHPNHRTYQQKSHNLAGYLQCEK